MPDVPLKDKDCKLNVAVKKDDIRKTIKKDRTEENNCI